MRRLSCNHQSFMLVCTTPRLMRWLRFRFWVKQIERTRKATRWINHHDTSPILIVWVNVDLLQFLWASNKKGYKSLKLGQWHLCADFANLYYKFFITLLRLSQQLASIILASHSSVVPKWRRFYRKKWIESEKKVQLHFYCFKWKTLSLWRNKELLLFKRKEITPFKQKKVNVKENH